MEARPQAASLVREAKERGMWVHVGRVNTLQRICWCMALGVDSIDGSGFARFTRARLPVGVATPDRPTQQTLL
jgi:EAL domain-containing protein (putative c-di-GMP-specific phosphodiesterase class I)